jgi:hypothetical protein
MQENRLHHSGFLDAATPISHNRNQQLELLCTILALWVSTLGGDLCLDKCIPPPNCQKIAGEQLLHHIAIYTTDPSTTHAELVFKKKEKQWPV